MNSSSLTVHQNDHEVSTAFVVSESCRVSAWLLIDVTATLTCCGFCGLATCLSLLWSLQTFPSACGCSERGLWPFSRPVMAPTRPVVCADLPRPHVGVRAGSAALPPPCDGSHTPCLLLVSLQVVSRARSPQPLQAQLFFRSTRQRENERVGKPGPGLLLSLPSALRQDSLILPAAPCDDTGLFIQTSEAHLNLMSRVFIADQSQRRAVQYTADMLRGLTDAQRPAPQSPF